MNEVIVQTESLGKQLGTTSIFTNISFQVKQGEMVALWGKSGTGKSSLLQIIGLLDNEYEGHYSLFGKDIRSVSPEEQAQFRNKEIGFIFQSFELLNHINCLENVMLPYWFSKNRKAIEHAQKKALALCEQLGLGLCIRQFPQQLSGGEKQRTVIARALFNQPKLLLCDEPTNNLDQQNAQVVLGLFQQFLTQGGTIIIATHEQPVAQTCSSILTLGR